MTWVWVGVWFVLVLAAVALFALLGRSLFHKAVALVRELGQAGERLSELQARIGELNGVEAADDVPAVFAQPVQLRAERIRERRARARTRTAQAARKRRSALG